MTCSVSHEKLGQIGNRLVLVVSVLAAAIPLVTAIMAQLLGFGSVAERYRANAQVVLVDWLLTNYQEQASWEAVAEGLQQVEDHPINDWRGFFTIVDTAGRVAIAGAGYIPGDRLSPTELAVTSPLFVDGLPVGRLLIAKTPPPRAVASAWRVLLGSYAAVITSFVLVIFWARRQLVTFLIRPAHPYESGN